MICEKLRASAGLGIVDIDSELREKDPLIWSSYAPDIYNTIHVREVCVVKCYFSHFDYRQLSYY